MEVIKNMPGQVDQVFCANCALVWGGKALVSNMFNPPRRAEAEPTIEWFKERNFEVSGGNSCREVMTRIDIIHKIND